MESRPSNFFLNIFLKFFQIRRQHLRQNVVKVDQSKVSGRNIIIKFNLKEKEQASLLLKLLFLTIIMRSRKKKPQKRMKKMLNMPNQHQNQRKKIFRKRNRKNRESLKVYLNPLKIFISYVLVIRYEQRPNITWIAIMSVLTVLTLILCIYANVMAFWLG